MAKQKHAKPREFEREQIRSLKKELRNRDQEIKHLQKQLGYNQTKGPKKKKSQVLEELEGDCPECSKGHLKDLDLAGRIYQICQLCGYRKKK